MTEPEIANQCGPINDPQLIDLNQPDIEALRISLRSAFPPQILSKGALNGIIDWRKARGTFSAIENLGEIRGIGGAVLSALQPRLAIGSPHLDLLAEFSLPNREQFQRPKQVQLILGPHGDAFSELREYQLSVEILAKIKEIVGRIGPSDPLTLWLEQGFPSNFIDPLDSQALIEGLERVVVKAGEDLEQSINSLLNLGYLPAKVHEFLRLEHDLCCSADSALSQQELYDALSRLRFLDQVFWWLESENFMGERSEPKPRPLVLKKECAPFESWCALAAAGLWMERANSANLAGNLPHAVASMAKMAENIEISSIFRDQELSRNVMQHIKTASDNEITIVVRGSAHGEMLAKYLTNSGIVSESHYYSSDLPHSFPLRSNFESGQEWQDKMHRGFILEDLALLSDCVSLKSFDNPGFLIESLVLKGLCKSQVESWAKDIGTMIAQTDREKAEFTLKWLLAQNAPGMDLIRSIFNQS